MLRMWQRQAGRHRAVGGRGEGARPPVDRRVLPDRRQRPTTLRSVLARNGRRRGFRRPSEGHRAFVDHPSPRVIALVIWIMVGSVLDAFLTSLRLAEGFHEVNPFMALAFAVDAKVFLAAKLGATAGGSWLLAALQQFPLASWGLYGLAAAYVGVLGIHSMLILAGG